MGCAGGYGHILLLGGELQATRVHVNEGEIVGLLLARGCLEAYRHTRWMLQLVRRDQEMRSAGNGRGEKDMVLRGEDRTADGEKGRLMRNICNSALPDAGKAAVVEESPFCSLAGTRTLEGCAVRAATRSEATAAPLLRRAQLFRTGGRRYLTAGWRFRSSGAIASSFSTPAAICPADYIW
jgi:hypothetical protein